MFDCWPAGPLIGFGSAQTNDTVTGALYHPFALGDVVGAPVMVGEVVSMSIPLTTVLLTLAALSTAVPLALLKSWAEFCRCCIQPK